MRYLLLALLLVLCIATLSTAALAADSWAAGTTTVPANMTWDGSDDISAVATNDGTTTWDATYELRSVMGVTGAAVAIDRWGTTAVPVTGTVAPAANFTFDSGIVAPPITTFKYNLPIGPTSVAVLAGFDDKWAMANAGGLIQTDLAGGSTVVTRFPDDAASWAAFQIEECAGRVPVIVKGMTSGDYEPLTIVSRDQMAAFIRRALDLPIHPNAGTFTDVTAGYWAGDDIQTLYDANIVKGQSATEYKPLNLVTRDQMAVFLARGLAGGDANVVTPSVTHDFSDVPANYWASRYIQYCYANNVTKGVTATEYMPLNFVTRDQMAVFIYRTFIAPTPSVVVVAGPGVTEVDTAAGYDGWTSTNLAPPATPRTAYVGVDAVRLGDAQTVTVSFSVMDGTTELATSGDLTLDAATVKPAAVASGVPYAYVKWALPLDLPVGVDYALETTVNGVVLDRKPTFSVGTVGTVMPVEGFEGAALPAGWTVNLLNSATESFIVDTIASDMQWQQNCGTPAAPDNHVGAPTGVPDGTYAVMNWPGASRPADDWNNEPNEGEIITPAIDCSTFVAPQLHFSGAVAINTDNANGDCQYSVDGGATWTSVDPENASDGGWWCACCDGSGWRSPDGFIDFTFDLPGAAGKSDVRVKWTFTGATPGDGTCCWGWIVDSVSVTGIH